jgi:hypothetical protein
MATAIEFGIVWHSLNFGWCFAILSFARVTVWLDLDEKRLMTDFTDLFGHLVLREGHQRLLD